MFIRLKRAEDKTEINVIASNILSFRPAEDGSEVQVVGGLLFKVAESCRTIRHQLKQLDADKVIMTRAPQGLEVMGAAG